FNNGGVDALVRNVAAAKRTGDGVLGINIGKNKDTPNASAHADYLHCLERVYALADYVVVNISSPNTAGLRELQAEQALRRVLGDLGVDGVIATNTTVSRIAVQEHRHAHETGGLSGEPLMNKSTAVLRMLRTRLPEHIPLVGVGGILSGADAAKKTAAGASLV